MNNRDKIQLLIRLARNNPEESTALLTWAEELLRSLRPQSAFGGAVTSKSVSFPLAIFRVYKGRRYEAILMEDWRIELNGAVYCSPSAAATAVSGHPENGWRTWKYVDPKSGRVAIIDSLRDNRG